MPLGRKHTLTNKQWLDTVANIKTIISAIELKKYEDAAIADIVAKAKNKKVAYAYSGGKDSIVLASLCQKAGIADCLMGISNLEFAPFMDWVDRHKPAGLEIINTGQDMAWLAKNQDIIFPDATGLAKWCREIHLKAQTQYFKKHNLDMLILGRRRATWS